MSCKFLSLPIVYMEPKETFELAWNIAETNRLVHLYDAIYLAISDGIPFWTADERLVNAVTQTKAIIKLLGGSLLNLDSNYLNRTFEIAMGHRT